MKKIIFILLCITLFYGCSVQKRHYRNGFAINFGAKNTTTKKEEIAKIKEKVVAKDISTTITAPSKKLDNNVASISKEYFLPPNKNKKDDKCDILYFRDGKIVEAKVLEITPTEIRYKNCENLDGPLIVVDKNTVKSIKYKNGFTEEFTVNFNKIEKKPTIAKNSDNKYEPFAITSFVCSLLSFLFIPAILGIVFGFIALKNIKENPSIKGYAFAVAGIVLSLLYLFLILIIIMIILSGI